MTMQNPVHQTTLDAADAAKMVRKALKAAFPGVKFSVRSDRFAGGSSVDVRYTDGPTSAAVEAVATQFGQRGFDGSDDSTYYVGGTYAVLTDDGIVAPTYRGFVSVTREYSSTVLAAFPYPASYRAHDPKHNIDFRLPVVGCQLCHDVTNVGVECAGGCARFLRIAG